MHTRNEYIFDFIQHSVRDYLATASRLRCLFVSDECSIDCSNCGTAEKKYAYIDMPYKSALFVRIRVSFRSYKFMLAHYLIEHHFECATK